MSRPDPKTVLIADDDRDLVNVLSVRCRRMGLRVLVAHDSFTALSLARARTPDLICLDVEMPAGNGLCACEMLASDETFHQIPIVMLTGRTDPDTIVRCHTLCAYYVEKCANTWSRVEPLLRELLDLPESRSESNPAVTQRSTASSPVLTPQPEQAAAPLVADGSDAGGGDVPILDVAESVETSPPASDALELRNLLPNSQSSAAADPAEPVALETSDETGSNSEGASPGFSADEPQRLCGSDRVWRHFAHAFGRFVGATENEELPDSGRTDDNARDADALVPTEPAVPPQSAKPTQWHLDQDDVVPVASLDEMWSEVSGHASPGEDEKEEEQMPNKRAPESEPTILIADDDTDLLQMLVLRCGQMGVKVFRSPDAMHALLGVHRIRPDLVILDVNMPGGNGLSVCEMLTGDETLNKTPVIVMTGDTNEEIPRRCQALRAQFVAKGAGLWERLEPAIRRALGLPAPRSSSSPAAADCPTAQNEGRPRILCIDDDPDISKILKFRLEPLGMDVIRAFNGMQGYWTALDMQPNLVILDMVMPDGAGNYILGRLRSHPLTEKTPVIMLTGLNTPGVRRQMFGLGVDAYLTKPLDFQALIEHIRQYVPLSKINSSSADKRPNPDSGQPAEIPNHKSSHLLMS